MTLETSLKFATNKFYVVNTKATKKLTGSCAIALDLLSLHTQSKTPPSETSSKCESNLTTHDSKYGNSWQNLTLNKKIISPSVLEN